MKTQNGKTTAISARLDKIDCRAIDGSSNYKSAADEPTLEKSSTCHDAAEPASALMTGSVVPAATMGGETP
eukprot:SAG31_NODE_19492_length_600_cov_0.992016_2_plen_70_part_01